MALGRVLLAAEEADRHRQAKQTFDQQIAGGLDQPAIARLPVVEIHEQVAQFDQGCVAEAPSRNNFSIPLSADLTFA